MAFRRTLFAAVGDFDVALDVGTPASGGGDIEFLYRAVSAGYVLRYEPAAMVRHVHRRDDASLQRQVYNNGRGFAAYLFTAARDHPQRRAAVLRFALRRWVWGWLLRAIRSLVAIMVVAAVAGLVALIWPQQTAQVGQAVVEAPLPSLGIGLLTVVAGTALIVALAITICLSPVAILAALALSAAGLFGWIAVGGVVGERLLRALNAREIAPLWAAGLGALLITLIGTGLSSAFCLAPLGRLMIFALGCIGLGAVVLTRLGTTTYVPPTSLGSSPPLPTPPLEAPTPIEAPEPTGPPAEPPEGAAGGDET
jgi:hypothetical protein